MNKIVLVGILSTLILIVDYYVFQGVKSATGSASDDTDRYIKFGFWGLTALSIFGVAIYNLLPPELIGKGLRTIIMVWLFMFYISKIVVLPFLIFDDLRRGVMYLIGKLSPETITVEPGTGITRSKFMSQIGLGLAAIPFFFLIYGVVSGAHDYKVINKKVALKNLPDSFKGLRIGQLSDIHSGSFYNKEAVEKGVQKLINQKVDVIFFTGDLVNNTADEMTNYMDVFNKVQAPLGVFSVL